MKPSLLVLILSAATLAPLGFAQSADELRAHDLLRDVDLLVNTAGAHAQGEDGAKLVVVEFLDFQCPYCGLYAEQTLPQVLDEYVKTGKVRYIVLNFPQEKIHPFAPKAAELAECAGEQGKYWEAHVRLFANQQALDADALGLDQVEFQKCMQSGRAAAKVTGDLEQGRKLKMPGTPSFYFGYPDPEDPSRVRAVKLLVGNQTFQVFRDVLDPLLATNGRR